MRILNTTRGTELASDARYARTFLSRLVGLLGRASLRPGEALVIQPCSSVHTAFMRFTIDLAYFDREGKVLKVVRELKPFRVSALFRAACSVVELPQGTLERTGTLPGDTIIFSD